MTLHLEQDWTIEYPLAAEGGHEDYILLDPDLLPKVCVHCAGEGVVPEKFFFLERLPRSFWKALGVAVTAPVLFTLGAFASFVFGGTKILAFYSSIGGLFIGTICMAAGFYAARKANDRGRYALTFYLCRHCERIYRGLSKRVLVFSWTAMAVFTILLFSPILWVGAPERARTIAALVLVVLAAFLGCVAVTLKLHFSAQRFRGIRAYWSFGESVVRVTFSNMAVAALASAHRKKPL